VILLTERLQINWDNLTWTNIIQSLYNSVHEYYQLSPTERQTTLTCIVTNITVRADLAYIKAFQYIRIPWLSIIRIMQDIVQGVGGDIWITSLNLSNIIQKTESNILAIVIEYKDIVFMASLYDNCQWGDLFIQWTRVVQKVHYNQPMASAYNKKRNKAHLRNMSSVTKYQRNNKTLIIINIFN